MDGKMDSTSFLFISNSVFIEELYQQYLKFPESIDKSWISFFDKMGACSPVNTKARIISSKGAENRSSNIVKDSNILMLRNQELIMFKAQMMITSYRDRGHLLANLDPLSLEKKCSKTQLNLALEDFGLTNNDNNMEFSIEEQCFSAFNKCNNFNELVNKLDTIYLGSIGCEFSHVKDKDERNWLYNDFENLYTKECFSAQEKRDFLFDLLEIESFEQYLHKKFPGAKRFSIEGGESSVIALNELIDKLAKNGVQEIVLGLAHRGRLSTLTKVMEKPYKTIFSEFMGRSNDYNYELGISGDVKYHMGWEVDKNTRSGSKIHLSLMSNPSHLEAINPILAGIVRAKQDKINDTDRIKIAGILMHGDAAFCGQGVVSESLIMSQLKSYNVGGIIHIIINNQIGFTADTKDYRAGRYCTEIAKIIDAPILHVNGDDIEAVIKTVNIAYQYHQKFHKDVVIDVVCYRKYGHNEGDDPMYTQSIMYNVINNKISLSLAYSNKLIADNILTNNAYTLLQQQCKMKLDEDFAKASNDIVKIDNIESNNRKLNQFDVSPVITGVTKVQIQLLVNQLSKIPNNFDLNKKLQKLLSLRSKEVIEKGLIDWACAEQLAFASILAEKVAIRLTGQDVERGTFSHRHAILHSQSDLSIYQPLNNLSKEQAFFEIADSNLSEYGVLGFEYGYSLYSREKLVIWEAQFGDFANGAQIIFDQFISAAESKWRITSGLVVLLPHGFEGQGPEHSSARLERFLQIAAQSNIQVVYPTTPSSIFHLLRRQVKSSIKKPLIVMSPKSILRNKLAVSNIDEIDEGTYFISIIDEIDKITIKLNLVKKVIFCTGKLYYEILDMRRKKKINNVAIIRIEQLYPLDTVLIKKLLVKYKQAKDFLWVQEEPKNMGAWQYIGEKINRALYEVGIEKNIRYVGKESSASPAVGYQSIHNQQQQALLDRALL